MGDQGVHPFGRELDEENGRITAAVQRVFQNTGMVEAEVAVMLDTDLYIKHSLDQAFYKLTHCKVAGAFRGKGGFRLDGPRPAWTVVRVVGESMEV